MQVELLIEKLKALPPETEVMIFDHRKNFNDDAGEGSSLGLYQDFEVAEVAEEKHRFAVLSFDNEDFDDDGEV